MFSTHDTIVAIATPPGRSGVGVIRISGAQASGMALTLLGRSRALVARRATLCRFIDGVAGTPRGLDRVVATFFPRPGSYTGEDVVEVSAHGSPILMRELVRAAVRAGARLAEPGEFTFRAYLNGRLDLVQAEAVADLIDAVTPLQARTAFDQLEGTLTEAIGRIDAALFDVCARLEASLDFPDEGYHFVDPGEAATAVGGVTQEVDRLLATSGCGRLVREGRTVVIVGRTNVGKSSIFNRLAGADRAIVTATPGTTRDLLTETIDLAGIPITLVDTAGIRRTEDEVEAEGVSRAERALGIADLALVVLDRSCALEAEDRRLLECTRNALRVVAANKTDLPQAWDGDALAAGDACVRVSARSGGGFQELRDALAHMLGIREPLRDPPALTNVRHIALLTRARDALGRATAAAAEQQPEEYVLADLQDARAALEEITGRRTPDDVLRHIFERFCVGK